MSAQRIIAAHGKSLPSESLPKAVAFVVRDAKRITPVVSPATINTELFVETSPKVLLSGKLSVAKNKQHDVVTVTGKGTGAGEFKDVPLAWLMIGARAKPLSNYNDMTSMRWLIQGGHPYKGHKVSEFAGIMAAFVSRMVKPRRSSTGFFQISWNAVLGAIAPFVPPNYRAAVLSWAGQRNKGKSVTPLLGSATMTGRGSSYVTLQIDNNMGLDSEFPNLSRRRNEAAHRILEPVLQRSINSNFDQQMALIAKKGWLEKAPGLKALGVNVN